jgi:hypothetical protein
MHRAKPIPPSAEPLPLRPFYSIRELATAASMSRERILRMLDGLGIERIMLGSSYVIPYSELERKALPFLESVRSLDLRRETGEM